MMADPRSVALFYDGFETQALEVPFGSLKSEARRHARAAWRRLRGLQVNTGYFTAFNNLRRSLEARGIEVRVNDFAWARANPKEPIGISGFPRVFDRVHLPNPAVFGPGYVPPPDEIEKIMARCNIKVVTLPSEWPCGLWRDKLGEVAQPMFVAIDLAAWPDTSQMEKPLDLIVYDKIRWRLEDRAADLRDPLLAALDARGLRYRVLRYGAHHLSQFRQALRDARGLVFLCEHETQGLAYQEAMASGLPILAWDEGELVDPHQGRFAPPGLRVSSVPYFDARCGLTFTRETMIDQLDAFMQAIDGFSPRAYVAEALSPEAGAARYLTLLQQARAAAD
ncbi:glycosyltransferase [Marinibacterium sp. SX1]|uniref:glycosyltransferase n=1 Tax=Marinibacterium sp. SX1 TaxID=3388424 RepID=UPI003D1715C8